MSMRRYLIIDVASGEIARTSICAVSPEPQDGFVVMLHDAATPSTHYLMGGQLLAYASDEASAKAVRPHAWVAWSNSAMAWIDQRDDAERLAWLDSEARAARAALLVQSDWTQLADAQQRLGAGRVKAWNAYRQALCDITAQPGYPAAIVWPVAPGA